MYISSLGYVHLRELVGQLLTEHYSFEKKRTQKWTTPKYHSVYYINSNDLFVFHHLVHFWFNHTQGFNHMFVKM